MTEFYTVLSLLVNPFFITPAIPVVLFVYCLGGLPFGLILTRIAGLGDIRQVGSGNIGATNVLRTGNKLLAAVTLLLDGSKGAIAILLILGVPAFYTPTNFSEIKYPSDVQFFLGLCLGFFAILGHCFPVWLKFKGGKGVATALGVLLAAVPYAGLAACLTWLLVALTFKYSSLAALVAVAVAPIATLFIYGPFSAGVCVLITLLVWLRHKANIQRLLKGEEPKIGSKNKKADEGPAA